MWVEMVFQVRAIVHIAHMALVRFCHIARKINIDYAKNDRYV